jgi:hypothetical protein
MCIAIAKPAGVTIPRDILENCFENNPDGAGFMYYDPVEQLVIKRGFFSFEDFWKAWEPYQEKVAGLHFRIKTHGQINEENCHPFQISTKLAFIHNGIITRMPVNKDHSDTWQFNERMLKPLLQRYGYGFVKDSILQQLIEEYIGYSKLVFLNSRGQFFLYNERYGTNKDGVWYSNDSFKKYHVKKVYSGAGYKNLEGLGDGLIVVMRGGVPYKTTVKAFLSMQKKRAEVSLLRRPANDISVTTKGGGLLQLGTECKVNTSYKHLRKGEIVYVCAFGPTGTIWVKQFDGSMIMSPIHYLDVNTPEEEPQDKIRSLVVAALQSPDAQGRAQQEE